MSGKCCFLPFQMWNLFEGKILIERLVGGYPAGGGGWGGVRFEFSVVLLKKSFFFGLTLRRYSVIIFIPSPRWTNRLSSTTHQSMSRPLNRMFHEKCFSHITHSKSHLQTHSLLSISPIDSIKLGCTRGAG